MDVVLGLVWLHLSGHVVWVGSILAVAVVLTSGSGTAQSRGEIGLRVYRLLSVPAFVLSFTAGAVRLLLDVSYYFSQHHWMHGKLVFAFAAIGLHHVIGARAKKLAAGTVQDAGPTAILSLAFVASAVIAAFFAIFKLPD
jgi:protoporphyrinogen IX oxidase